jgi:hypothetical protein
MQPLGHERWESHSVWYGIRYTVEALGSCPWGTIKTLHSRAPSTREEILLDSNDGVPRGEASHWCIAREGRSKKGLGGVSVGGHLVPRPYTACSRGVAGHFLNSNRPSNQALRTGEPFVPRGRALTGWGRGSDARTKLKKMTRVQITCCSFVRKCGKYRENIAHTSPDARKRGSE